MSQPLPKPRRRRTKYMIEIEKRKILEFIQAGATDRAIMEGLHIPRKMFERRIQSIREGHLKEVLTQQNLEAKASALMVCQEKMKWLEMQAQRIVMDEKRRNTLINYRPWIE